MSSLLFLSALLSAASTIRVSKSTDFNTRSIGEFVGSGEESGLREVGPQYVPRTERGDIDAGLPGHDSPLRSLFQRSGPNDREPRYVPSLQKRRLTDDMLNLIIILDKLLGPKMSTTVKPNKGVDTTTTTAKPYIKLKTTTAEYRELYTTTAEPITELTTTTAEPITELVTTTAVPITESSTTTDEPITESATTTAEPITELAKTTAVSITESATTTTEPRKELETTTAEPGIYAAFRKFSLTKVCLECSKYSEPNRTYCRNYCTERKTKPT